MILEVLPTRQQFKAFIYVRLLGWSEHKTAAELGVSQQAISRLLQRMHKRSPEIFDVFPKPPKKSQIQRHTKLINEKVRQKF